MMYRQVDTGTWDDPWFAELEPDAKLLFLYLLTNRRSTAAGVFEITARAMAFETGLDSKRVKSALEAVSSRVQWWPEHQVIWVRNFLRHQAVSPKFYMSAWSEMRDMPDNIRDEVGQVYPILTRDEKPPEKKEDIEALLIPYPKGMDTVSEPSHKTSTRPSTSSVKASSLDNGANAPDSEETPPKKTSKRLNYPDDFEAFWQRYPSGRGDKKPSYEVWKRLAPDDELRAEIMAGLEGWHKSERWMRGYIKQAQKWLSDRSWESIPPPPLPSAITVHSGGKPNPNKRGGYTAGELMQLAEEERRRETA